MKGGVLGGPGDPLGSLAVFPEGDEDRKSRFDLDIDLSGSLGSSGGLGMYDLTSDESSTNIYISSINPKVGDFFLRTMILNSVS